MFLGYAAFAQIINIPEDYPSIQSGIDSAGNGDTILVAEGRYYENINFRGKAIIVASHLIIDNDSSHISRTIIDGSRPMNPDSASVVFMVSGEDSTSNLCGFTITGGAGTVMKAINQSDRMGGGILIVQCGGKIDRNLIEHNAIVDNRGTVFGGGIFAGSSNEQSFNIIISGNIIRFNNLVSNRSPQGAGLLASKGKKGSIFIRGNTISHNKAHCTGSTSAFAGGIHILYQVPSEGPFIVSDNLITDNELKGDISTPRTSPTDPAYFPHLGAGIFVSIFESAGLLTDLNPYPLIYNNTISNNHTDGYGGGIAVGQRVNRLPNSVICPRPFILNNSIIDNTAVDGAGIYNDFGTPVLVGNIIRNKLSNSDCNEIKNYNNGLIYESRNKIQGDWKGEIILCLGGNLYLNHEGINMKIKGTDMKTQLAATTFPPLWRIWWALVLYGLMLIFFLIWYRSFLLNRAKLRTALEVERLEKEKALEIDQMKSRFFANISHEFRTPLTLIQVSLSELAGTRQDPAKGDTDLLRVMDRNTTRLLSLINQLLDLSKLEIGNIRLNVSEGDLAVFLKRIVLSFLSLAESKHISYDYDLPDTSMSLFFDGDKLEKILTNLISNAFKFTPEGGQISVILKYLYQDDNDPPLNIELTVRDSGKGIPDDQIDKIFDRFYQVSSSDTREEEGTGIGLSLTKELVEVYRGEIKVESVPGRGSTFTVRLPVARGQFSEEEIVPAPDKTPVRTITEEPVTAVPEPEVPERHEVQATGKDGEIVLIVEDNYDLRTYIARNLEPFFQVVESENGRTGLEKAVDIIPNLLITDLMMPEMDGMELCKNMKENERTCHIPIVVLTAKADRDSKLNCLESGADDFIIKPFDMEELQVRVRNLIMQRKKLREKFNRDLLADPSAGPVRSPDDRLFEKILNCFNQHIDDTEFNTDQMAGELSLSRAQLFRKIQALTGHTPNDLLNRIRLRKAAMLFREGHSNIGQVMYAVGFSTPSYFARCFKEHYGLIPSEYIKRPG